MSQSDRRRAQAAMEAAWKSMEKKEKIPWIKKAAEDQKRYEVQYRHVDSSPAHNQPTLHTCFTNMQGFYSVTPPPCLRPRPSVFCMSCCVALTLGVLQRELFEIRTPAAGQRKPKFDGEPKKPPV